MEWIDLITPALAAFAALVAIGLGVQAFRQGRHIRRLEQRLEQSGVAGTQAPLERLQQLQQRVSTSSGVRPATGEGTSRIGIAIAAVVALAAIAAGVYWFVLRDTPPANDTPTATTTTTARTSSTAKGATTAPTTTQAAAPQGNCTNVKPLDDPGLVTVTVFNASGVTGAALNTVWPLLSTAGYTQGMIDNPPDGQSELTTSAVMFVAPADKRAACAVAAELGLQRVSPLDGYTPDQVGSNANVVVLVGRDLAGGR